MSFDDPETPVFDAFARLICNSGLSPVLGVQPTVSWMIGVYDTLTYLRKKELQTSQATKPDSADTHRVEVPVEVAAGGAGAEMPVISPDEPVQTFWPNDVQVVQAPAVENAAVETVSAEPAPAQVFSDVQRVRAVYPFAHCRGELTGVVIGFHKGGQFKRLSDAFPTEDLAWADASLKLPLFKCCKCTNPILAGDGFVRDSYQKVWCPDCWAEHETDASDFDAKADVQK